MSSREFRIFGHQIPLERRPKQFSESELFARNMREHAEALLLEHGVLERMPKHHVIANTLLNLAMAGPVSKEFAEIGDHTFVAAPVSIFGQEQVVSLDVWTFFSPERALEIRLFRGDTQDSLVLEKAQAFVRARQTYTGTRIPTLTDRQEWGTALNALTATVHANPGLVMPQNPLESNFGIVDHF
jgi:hypothetical protein